MSFSAKMALKYIKSQKKHSVFIVLSIASALMLVTFIFTLFSSFYSTMLYNERQKFEYHGIVHNISISDYEKLKKSEMITKCVFDPYLSDGTVGVANINFRNDIYDPETYIREFAEGHFDCKEYSLSLHEQLLEYEIIGIHAKAALVEKLAIIYVVVLFIIFCARFIIDTAFEISSKEKEVQFGILASLGASRKQITAILLWQGIFLSVVGVPLGLLLGTGAGYLIFSYVDSMGAMAFFTGSELFCSGVFSASLLYLLIAAVTGFVWVMLSAYGTGRRYSKRSPVESIRQSGKKIIKVKKSRVFGKLFGYTGELASKNIRREKKNFLITTLALSISFTMISLFSVFADYWNLMIQEIKSQGMLSQNIARDYHAIYFDGADITVIQDVDIKEGYRILENCPEGLYVSSAQYYFTFVSKDSYALREKIPFEKQYLESTTVGDILISYFFLNRKYYTEIFADSSGISYDELVNKKGFIICETYGYVDDFSGSPIKTGGDSIQLDLCDNTNHTIFKDAEVNLLGTAKPIGRGMFSSNYFSVILIGAEDYFYELNGGSVINTGKGAEFLIGLPRDNNKSLEQMDRELKTYLKDYPQFELSSYIGHIVSMEKQFAPIMILIASVIVIITFIAVINLVNIISTGIVNRRKETASLCALGMTRGQLFRMFVLEAVGYTASGGISALIISLIATLLANSYVISQNWDVLLLFSYGSAVISSLLTSLGGFVIATVTIFVCLKAFSRGSIAEQMKVTE